MLSPRTAKLAEFTIPGLIDDAVAQFTDSEAVVGGARGEAGVGTVDLECGGLAGGQGDAHFAAVGGVKRTDLTVAGEHEGAVSKDGIAGVAVGGGEDELTRAALGQLACAVDGNVDLEDVVGGVGAGDEFLPV